jgi:hypothetical protein
MTKTIPILLAVSLILGAGCDGDKETLSRYPSLKVPAYTQDDYIRGLSDSNPEVVYNSICHLGSSAAGFGNAMWGKEADPESKKFQDAQHVYDSVCAQLPSKDPQLVAVSLRFLQLFARGKDARSELMEPVCAVDSSHPLVQFEQVALLNILVDETTRLPEPLLKRLLNSRSWIVSRSTYGLIGRMPDGPFRATLLPRYRDTADEAEKLLLLDAMGQKLATQEIEFIEDEMLTTENLRIRSAAYGVLRCNLEYPEIQTWFIRHFKELSPEEQKHLFEDGNIEDEEVASDWMCQLLVLGYMPDDDCLAMLYGCFEEASEEDRELFFKLEQTILSIPEVAARWQALQEEIEEGRRLHEALCEEIAPIAKDVLAKLQICNEKHELPETEYEITYEIFLS